MKKKILLFTLTGGLAFFTLSSYTGGPARSGEDCLGTPTSGHGSSCGEASDCHGTAAGTTVMIALQTTTGSAVAHYTGGVTYNIVITGTSTSGVTALPKFGFQLCATNTAGTANYGTYGTLPTGVRKTVASGSINYDIIEQSRQLTATGSSYTVTIPWTAPVVGTGTVVLHSTLNAVNGDGDDNATDISGNTSLTVNEHTTAVAAVANNMNITAFPNPVSGNLSVRFTDVAPGAYTLSVYDLSGRKVAGQDAQVSAAGDATTLNTNTWARGIYQVVIENSGARQVIAVVKE